MDQQVMQQRPAARPADTLPGESGWPGRTMRALTEFGSC